MMHIKIHIKNKNATFQKAKRSVLLLFFLMFIQNDIFSQNTFSDSLKNQFIAYQQNHLQEKIYLHNDKQVYSASEICWFKIYLVDAFFAKPLSISKIAYVEILDVNNKPILQTKIAMKNGFGDGSLQIPFSVKTGHYKMRAYTNLMKNYSPDFYFEKQITIINTQQPAEIATEMEDYDLQFFPEGGNLVNGLQSKVAFRVTNQNGIGQHCKGIIVNQKMDTLIKFSSLKFGIGSFVFTPNTNNNYKAIFTLDNGKIISQNLPIIYNNGMVMSLQDVDNKLVKVKVQMTTPDTRLYLLVHTKGVLKQIWQKESLNNTVEFLVEKSILAEGISQFTLFNADRKPISERLYFKKPENSLQIDLKLNDRNFAKREKVELNISTKSDKDKAISANLSIAVYKIDSLEKPDETSISAYLWLTADLKGSVESPNYYLDFQNKENTEATDNLMLTHGWRRFNWDDILKSNQTTLLKYMPEYAGHIVKGKATNTNATLAKNLNCFISMPGTRTQFHQSTTNKEGIFNFDIKDVYNEGQIIVQSALKDSTYNFEIFNPFSDQFSIKKTAAFSFSGISTNSVNSLNSSAQIQNVYSKSKQHSYIYPKVDTTAFFVKPETTYLLDNYVRFTTMEEVLREYVLPISVKKRKDVFQLQILDNKKITFFETDPLLLLDGVPIFDTNKFMAYDPLKVRKLEVVTGSYYLGDMTFDGIANFTTYTGDMPGFVLDKNAVVIDYEGIQLQREFYMPKYDSAIQKESRMPDFRNTLYWNPTIITNENGTAKCGFYTSDQPGNYLLVIQGLNNEGVTGERHEIIIVKK